MAAIESSMPDRTDIEFVREASWDEIKQIWKSDEDSDEFRRKYAEVGYETWEDWRQAIIEPLQLDQLAWELYDIPNPSQTVSTFRGGPFKPWQQRYYGDKQLPSFADIAANDATDVKTRSKFREIMLSQKAMHIVGLEQHGDIYIVEGMHRSTSIALAAKESIRLDIPVQLYLAVSKLDKFEMLD